MVQDDSLKLTEFKIQNKTGRHRKEIWLRKGKTRHPVPRDTAEKSYGISSYIYGKPT